jgi:hypothetical protein
MGIEAFEYLLRISIFSKRATSAVVYIQPASLSFTSLNIVLDCLVALSPDLRLEIEVNQLRAGQHFNPHRSDETHLPLLRGPLSICVPVINYLIRPGILNLDCCVREGSLGAPLDPVARSFRDQERLAAPLIAVPVNALLDGEV